MQYLPRPRFRSRSAPTQDLFTPNTVILENIDSYEYLSVTLKSTGYPAHYIDACCPPQDYGFIPGHASE